jgi:FtsH-binding integral membrane protein
MSTNVRFEEQFSNLIEGKELSAERLTFLRKTYLHLAGAIALFVVIEWYLVTSEAAQAQMIRLLGGGTYRWIFVLAAFALVSWLARSFARKITSPPMQYLGLALYVVAEAFIFMPLIYIAVHFVSPTVLPTAALLTGALFVAITTFALTTKKDFSFLSGFLVTGSILALGVIIAGIIFGFTLGLWFSAIMIVFASVAILFDTSKILHHYPPNMHVAASLELFASIALLFWYVLRLMLELSE